MRVLIAVDKFKGSVTGDEAAQALATGLRSVGPDVGISVAPVADGGDGTIDAAVAAGFARVPVAATGPTGEAVRTSYARRAGTAIVELATVCGLQRLPGGRLEPWTSSTFGLGEVIAQAVGAGARKVVVGVGGSAGTDGGVGLLQALGATVLDASGQPVARGAFGPAAARSVDLRAVRDRLAGVELFVACDVDNPLLGPAGAAAVYAPQKGATAADVATLDAGLAGWRAVVGAATGTDLSAMPGAGAAGGAGYGLLVAGARMAPGADLLLDLVDFAEHLRDADLVITGEGSLDAQTLAGKAPARVAARATAAGVPVVAVAGRCRLDAGSLAAAGIRQVYALSDLEPDVAASMADARALLSRQGAAIARDWLVRS